LAGLGLAFKAFFRCLKKGPTSEKIAELIANEKQALLPPPKGPVFSSSAQLLAAFQKEGRFIDFLQEDLQGFPDAQVGSVARGVHKGCRQVLRQYLILSSVLDQKEGEKVTVDEGFDPHRISLVGKVEGSPPFTGILRHHGWRMEKDQLPPLGAADILLPAEVELG
jgi:hypothetical protein